MKKKILFLLLVVICIFTSGCTRTITYDTFEKNIKNKESMIVEVMQNGCSHCESFEPVFSSFMKENNLKYVKLNLTNVSDAEYQKLSESYGVTGTPTVLFFKNGKELSEYRISGDQTKDVLEKIFKKAGYIK
ncbi:MAG: thioredoxin family protein [Bacilli bacterium]|nr:thioredoxin family protein [Bacilli bacterium]